MSLSQQSISDMSEKEEPRAHVKLLIHRKQKRVIVAEADQCFVDILYSFLTLPLGTIVKLVRNQEASMSAVSVGCLNNLYASVENLPTEYFRTKACKRMVLCPRNVREEECSKLMVNLDCGEKLKHFICSDVTCGSRNHRFVSYYETTKCTCGKLMNKEITVAKMVKTAARGSSEEDLGDAGTRGVLFIGDDLTLIHKSAATLLGLIHLFGIKDINQLDERIVGVGYQEVLNLLKNSLTSKYALSETFLRKQEPMRSTVMHKPPYSSMPKKKETGIAFGNMNLNVKVMRRKSTSEIFFVEASAEFVDLLFTFLTIPLFSALEITEANSSQFPGCVTNLLPVIMNTKSLQVRGVLPPLYSCHPLLPNILPRLPPAFCRQMRDENETIFYVEADSSLLSPITGEKKQSLQLVDPKSPNAASSNSVGYVKRTLSFLVWDDLSVKPLDWFSPLSLLKEINGPLDDIEKMEVSIGEQEALCLLRESLFTSSALASLLNFMHKDQKQEKQ